MLKKWRKILLPKMSKSRWLWTGLLTLGLLLFVGQTAQAFGPADIINGLINFFARLMTELARIFIALSIFFLEFFLKLAQYNGYVTAGVVELGWLMVRDVANMFFVVVLLVIAFGTILGIESYQWNKMLIKFILAAVFINFSKLISGLIIDFAHVFTITFLNAIMATAGGNLIEMFKLESIFQFVSQDPLGPDSDLRWEVLGAAAIALIFAIFAAFTIGAYLIVMAARVVVLWVLIILSPLAFIMQIMPQTQEHAKKWWDKFTKQVMVAPVMVFFLWLAFATLSSADTLSQMGVNFSSETEATKMMGAALSDPKLSLTEVSTWENMAHFIIAMAFLIVGINVVQGMGVVAGGLVQKAQDFAGSVAKIATGYAAGRWLAGKAGEGAKKVGKGALWYAPWVGGEKWAAKGKILGHAALGWYRGKGYEMTEEGEKRMKDIERKKEELAAASPERRATLQREIAQLEKDKEIINAGEGDEDEKKKRIEDKDAQIKKRRDLVAAAAGMTEEERKAKEKEIEQMEEELPKYMGGGLIGRISRQGMQLEKQLEKTKKQAEVRQKILWKRIGSEAGGNVSAFGIPIKFGMGTKGIFGTGFLGDKYAEEVIDPKTGEKSKKYKGSDAQDRIERGWLQGEEMRSKAKDEEYENLGKEQVLAHARLKYDVVKGKFSAETDKGTMMQRIVRHKLAAKVHDESEHRLEAEAHLDVILGRIKFGLGTVPRIGELFENQAMHKLRADQLKSEEERLLKEKMAESLKNSTDVDRAGNLIEDGEFAGEEVKAKITVLKQDAEEKLAVVDDANKEIIAKNTEIAALEKSVSESKSRFQELQKKITNKSTLEGLDDDEKQEFGNLIDDREKLTLLTSHEDIDGSVAYDWKYKLAPAQGAQAEAKAKLKELRGSLAEEADRLRRGDSTVAEKYAHIAEEEARKAEEKARELLVQADTVDVGDAGGDVERLKEEAATQKSIARKKTAHARSLEQAAEKVHEGGGVAWQYGVAKANEAEQNRLYSYQHNFLLSESEQRVVWNKRGINTPANALREMIEQMEKDFDQMPYDVYVANAGTMFLEMAKKAEDGLIDDGDRAALAGFFKRGFNESWVDDILIGVMKNSESRTKIGAVMGWRDASFSPDKIRDLEMFMATGGDLKMASRNVVKSELLDAVENAKAETGYQMSSAQLEEGLRTGVWKNAQGEVVTGEKLLNLKKKIEETLVKRGRVLTDEQKKWFNMLLDIKKNRENNKLEYSMSQTEARGEFLDEYKKALRESQGSMEWFGNLRNAAIKNGHGENAGWFLSREIDGEQMYVGSGVQMARDHVYYDINKMSQYDRAKFHPHTALNLQVADDTGQISTELRDFEDKTTRGDITDANGFRGTTPRMVQFMMGLSSADKVSDQKDKDGEHAGKYRIGAAETSRNLRKNYTNKTLFNRGHTGTLVLPNGRKVKKPDTPEEKLKLDQALTAMEIFRNILIPKYINNQKDFAMLTAQASGLNPQAGLQGKMNMVIPYIDNQGNITEKPFTEIGDFVEFARQGNLGFDCDLPKFEAERGGNRGGGSGSDFDPATMGADI